MIHENNNKVILGFSGGVDSSAACLILQERGFEVSGLYFDIHGNTESEDIISIRKTADSMGIELITIDVSKSFEKAVIEPFCALYEGGFTPNPCILCNPAVKFRVLIDAANERGINYIATGHYAGIAEHDGLYFASRGANLSKDQSYMLARLPQEILSRVIFPLSTCTDKQELRELLKANNIPNFNAKDSQDICFIQEADYTDFLIKRNCKNIQGYFCDVDGNRISPHKGILHYTVGQRKGLGVALGKPAFVKSIDTKTGNVVLCTDESLILQEKVIVNQYFFTGYNADEAAAKYDGKRVTAKLRYSRKEGEATLKFLDNSRLLLDFDEPQRAPTPGQSAVIYDNNIVIGTGFIE